jgi:hypothetical protein
VTLAAAQPDLLEPEAVSGLLASRGWWARRKPYPHILAKDVFHENIYGAMERQYMQLLAKGLSEAPDPSRLSRTVLGYDVYAQAFTAGLDPPLGLLLSPEFHDHVANVLRVRITRDVNGGFHHHLAGSQSGRIHNDLNPGWFVDAPSASGVNLSRSDLCSYPTGESFAALRPYQVMRAIAIIFFLANGAWAPGDGGETGLYSNHRGSVDSPDVTVPPLDNSMLIFHCTPYSYHAFIGNRRRARNSAIMWLHCQREDVYRWFGEHSVVNWRSG